MKKQGFFKMLSIVSSTISILFLFQGKIDSATLFMVWSVFTYQISQSKN